MQEIRGVITAMATPFDEGGGVDLDAARKLARHLIGHGNHGVVVSGTSGESPTLDDREKLDLLSAVLDEIGDEAIVIIGSGSNDTRHSVELTRAAADAGAHGALIVTPYYNRPNEAGIKAHFAAVAEGSPELPVVLYNIPSRTNVNMPPDLLSELSGISTVVAVKQANDDDLGPVEGLDVLAGNDTVFIRTLEFGGAGGILVAAHLVGDRMRQMWDLAQAGDIDRAREIDAELVPVYEAMGVTTNPMPLKASLRLAGLDSGRMRLPMVPLDAEREAEMKALLDRAGLNL